MLIELSSQICLLNQKKKRKEKSIDLHDIFSLHTEPLTPLPTSLSVAIQAQYIANGNLTKRFAKQKKMS